MESVLNQLQVHQQMNDYMSNFSSGVKDRIPATGRLKDWPIDWDSGINEDWKKWGEEHYPGAVVQRETFKAERVGLLRSPDLALEESYFTLYGVALITDPKTERRAVRSPHLPPSVPDWPTPIRRCPVCRRTDETIKGLSAADFVSLKGGIACPCGLFATTYTIEIIPADDDSVRNGDLFINSNATRLRADADGYRVCYVNLNDLVGAEYNAAVLEARRLLDDPTAVEFHRDCLLLGNTRNLDIFSEWLADNDYPLNAAAVLTIYEETISAYTD